MIPPDIPPVGIPADRPAVPGEIGGRPVLAVPGLATLTGLHLLGSPFGPVPDAPGWRLVIGDGAGLLDVGGMPAWVGELTETDGRTAWIASAARAGKAAILAYAGPEDLERLGGPGVLAALARAGAGGQLLGGLASVLIGGQLRAAR